MTPVGFEPTPFRNGALSHRLRLLGQTVIVISGFNPKLTFLVPQGFHGEGEPARGAWDGSDPRAPIISTISIPSMPPYSSATGTRTQVARVRAEYPNQLDYSGV